MTALAEISKSILAIGPLQGSDLEQFNQEHPRDAAGRFAAQRGGGSALVDPRTARTQRRLRRARRAAGAKAVATQAKAKQAAEDLRAARTTDLASLRRERIRPELKRQELKQTKAAPEKTKAKAQPKQGEPEKMALNDPSFLTGELGHRIHDQTSHVVLTPEQARQFFDTGSLSVGAANKLWQTNLEGYPRGEVGYIAGNVADEAYQEGDDAPVILRIRHSHYADEESINGGLTLSRNQMLEPVIGEPGKRSFTDVMHFDRHGDVVEHPFREMRDAHGHPTGMHGPAQEIAHSINVIDVEVHTQYDWQQFMRHPPKKPVAKAWVEHEHPRDIESGRFTRLSARGVPPGQFSDPRIARSQRRRRAGARATQARKITRPPAEQALPERLERARPELKRQNLANRQPVERSGQRTRPKPDVEPVVETFEPEPQPRRTGVLDYGGEGPGGRIVTVERYRQIQANRKRDPVSDPRVRSVSRPKPKPAPTRVTPAARVTYEISDIGDAPRFLYDEYGNVTNMADIRAYQKAKRARSGKPSRAPS